MKEGRRHDLRGLDHLIISCELLEDISARFSRSIDKNSLLGRLSSSCSCKIEKSVLGRSGVHESITAEDKQGASRLEVTFVASRSSRLSVIKPTKAGPTEDCTLHVQEMRCHTGTQRRGCIKVRGLNTVSL